MCEDAVSAEYSPSLHQHVPCVERFKLRLAVDVSVLLVRHIDESSTRPVDMSPMDTDMGTKSKGAVQVTGMPVDMITEMITEVATDMITDMDMDMEGQHVVMVMVKLMTA